MHKLAVATVLASCGLPYTPLDDPPPAVPADAALDSASDAPAVIAAPMPGARRPLAVSAMHGAALRALAVTEDGTLAVSADVHGSLRWWPSLDGKREPVVLQVPAATALAVVHDGGGGAFAAVDEVGQLEVVRVGAAGDVRARVRIELARAVLEVRALDHAFLARCDDGAIVRIGADGKRGGEVRPGAHQHVTALAVRRGGVLAILDTGGEYHGRWVDPDKMRWGELTPSLAIDGTHVELSPGHRTIAASSTGSEAIEVIDVTTGTLVSTPLSITFVDQMLRPVGFQTDDDVATTTSGSVSWADVSHPFGFGAAVVTDAGVVAETEGGLVLANSATYEVEYLGYQLSTPLHARPLAAGGWLATDGRMVVGIDEHLRTARAYELPELPRYKYGFADVRPIDDRNAIATGYDGSSPDIYLFELDKGTATLVANALGVVDYDAAHRVLAYRKDGAFVFARFDPKSETFGDGDVFAFAGNSSQMHFLDPAKTHDLAVVIDVNYAYDDDTTATITRIRGIRADGTLELGKVRHLKLSPGWWRTNGNPDSLAGSDWTPESTAVVRPSPDGTLVAELSGDRVTLKDAHGALRWTAPATGASNLVWSKSGVLAGFGDGMARFDLATGEVSALQCGWRFGRWKKPLAMARAQMCEQSWTAAE